MVGEVSHVMWPQSKEQLSNLNGNGGRSSKTAKEHCEN